MEKFFLKEKIGIKRWSAIITGFIGVYIVLNPNFDNFNYMKLAPVACALCYAISMTITKITSDKDNLYSQTFHLYFFATFFLRILFSITSSFFSRAFLTDVINLFRSGGFGMKSYAPSFIDSTAVSIFP